MESNKRHPIQLDIRTVINQLGLHNPELLKFQLELEKHQKNEAAEKEDKLSDTK